MNRYFQVLFLLFLSICFAAAPKDTVAPVNIAVLDLEMLGGFTPEEAKGVSDRLRGALVLTGCYMVLERGSMETLLKEQDFQQTGLCRDTTCMVAMGRILAVRKMVGGSIGKVGRAYSINIKVMDVQTGAIESQILEDIRCSKEELVSFHMRNIARQLAGQPKLKEPWTMRWYAKWYVWTPVIAVGAAVGLYAILSDDKTDSEQAQKMRTIPVEGTIK